MESIEVSAKTVEDAVLEAAIQLGTTRDKVASHSPHPVFLESAEERLLFVPIRNPMRRLRPS